MLALKATGHYWRNLFVALLAKGYAVAVLNPLRTRRFSEEELQRTKTDAIDALGIARFAAQKRPPAALPCAQVLAIIGQLYGIERVTSDKHLDASSRQCLRQKQALPMLEKLQAYLQEQHAAALPKSPLSAAIGYALRNSVALTRYAEDGRLKIDNNGAEQALRPMCWAAKTGCSRGAKRRHTEPPSCVPSCRRVSTCRSIRSCICAMSSSASRRIRRGWSWS